MSYVYKPYLFWIFISTLQLLDLKLLHITHFRDASKEVSYDFIKKSDDVLLWAPSNFWVPCCSTIYALSPHKEKYHCLEVTATILPPASSVFCLYHHFSRFFFYQELSLSNYLCFLAGITISSWTPLLILLWPWGALMRECPEEKWSVTLSICSSHALSKWF